MITTLFTKTTNMKNIQKIITIVLLGCSLGLSAQSLKLFDTHSSTFHGDTLQWELKATDFQQITSLQFSLQWETSLLSLIDIGASMLPNPPVSNPLDTGKLTVSWYSTDGMGISLQDSSTLLTLHFLIKGCPDDELLVLLTDLPLLQEVYQFQEGNLTEITIESEPNWKIIQPKFEKLLPADTFLCQGENLFITLPYCSNCTYEWDSGIISDTLTIHKEGMYRVTQINEWNCVFTDTIEIQLLSTAETTIPKINFISPNEDGRNDQLKFEHIEKFGANSLTIFNRWGDIVFQTLDYQNNWAGEYREEPLPEGNYYYDLHLFETNTHLKSQLIIYRP